MGRYTTSQTFSDRDNNAALPYAAAKGLDQSDTKDTVTGSDSLPLAFGKGGGANAGVSSNGSSSGKLQVNKVSNAYGSTAGASSGDYHLYRAHRRSELFRLEKMDSDHNAKLENESFQLKLTQNIEVASEQTQRRANKRKRKKLAKQEARKKQQNGKTASMPPPAAVDVNAVKGNGDEESSEDLEEAALQEEARLLQENAEAKKRNAFVDNGGFLDGVRAMNSLLSRLKGNGDAAPVASSGDDSTHDEKKIDK